jgi:hypothetical protein
MRHACSLNSLEFTFVKSDLSHSLLLGGNPFHLIKLLLSGCI